MPETKTIVFDHSEIAESLVKTANIHEGHWGVYVEFGIRGANMNIPPGDKLLPAAIVPLLKVGIQRFPKPNSLTVDAAEVNPK